MFPVHPPLSLDFDGLFLVPWALLLGGTILFVSGKRWAAGWTTLFILLLVLLGIPAVFFVAFMGNTAFVQLLLKGLVILAASSALVLLLSRHGNWFVGTAAAFLLFTASMISALSVASTAVVVAETEKIRGSRPFCITQYGTPTIDSYAHLRAGSLFVVWFDKDGRFSKDAFLIVEHSDPHRQPEIFEWVFEDQAYRAFTSDLFARRKAMMCKPKPDFWSNLRIW